MGEDEGEGDKIDYPSSLPSPARGEGIVWLRRHFVSWRNRLDQNLQKLILDKSGAGYFSVDGHSSIVIKATLCRESLVVDKPVVLITSSTVAA